MENIKLVSLVQKSNYLKVGQVLFTDEITANSLVSKGFCKYYTEVVNIVEELPIVVDKPIKPKAKKK